MMFWVKFERLIYSLGRSFPCKYTKAWSSGDVVYYTDDALNRYAAANTGFSGRVLYHIIKMSKISHTSGIIENAARNSPEAVYDMALRVGAKSYLGRPTPGGSVGGRFL